MALAFCFPVATTITTNRDYFVVAWFCSHGSSFENRSVLCSDGKPICVVIFCVVVLSLIVWTVNLEIKFLLMYLFILNSNYKHNVFTQSSTVSFSIYIF